MRLLQRSSCLSALMWSSLVVEGGNIIYVVPKKWFEVASQHQGETRTQPNGSHTLTRHARRKRMVLVDHFFANVHDRFGIMGATLAPTNLSSRPPACLDPTFLQTLRYSEHQTWVGCPAELLYLLSVIDSLRSVHHSVPEREDTIASLCDCLGAFSPSTWAKDFPDQQHYESRYHLACTYKAAIEVYASHIIGTSSKDQYLSESNILDTTQHGIAHMLSIPPHDFHIKSLVWPAFVLGAETERLDLRQAVRATFRHIWVSSCCYNARNAARMLDKIWARDSDGSGDKSWLEFVWESEESWLFL